jgi:DNA polymerase
VGAARQAAPATRHPPSREIEACYQWLQGEIDAVKPTLIVALGATAAKALLGPRFRITQQRGQVQAREGLPDVLATYHPSFLLRAKDRRKATKSIVNSSTICGTAARYLVQDKSDR